MKITLKRRLGLKSAIVYLKLSRKVLRDEIQGFLNGELKFSNEIVARRIKEYLRNAGICDSNDNPTTQGHEAKETGFVSEREEGKYQIWYTQNDFIFGDRVFYFTRIKPEQYKQVEVSKLFQFPTEPFTSLAVMDKRKCGQDSEFTITSMAELGEQKDGSTLDCTWIWGGKAPVFSFAGSLKTDNTDRNGNNWIDKIDDTKPLDFKISIEGHIPSVLPNWNPQTGRCKFKLENIKDTDTYTYFEYSGDRPSQEYGKNYDSCYYENMPVEPYNLEEAKEWRDKIIVLKLADDYTHPDDFTDYVIETNRKEGFLAYTEELYSDMPNAEQYIAKLDSNKKSDRGREFWHLAAPLDLNVGVPQSLKKEEETFSLYKDESHSLNDIASKLCNKSVLEMVIYCDKYVTNYYQQRTAFTLLDCFGCSNTYVITDKQRDGFSDYYNRHISITVADIGSIYPNVRDIPHDRYIVFKHGGVLDVWTCTNSIDFIRFDTKGAVPPDYMGTILKSVTFTKVDPRILGEELTKYLEGK